MRKQQWWLTCAVLLAACHLDLAKVTSTLPKVGHGASAAPTTKASPATSAQAPGKASPSPRIDRGLLARPASDVTVLAGTVSLDVGYLIARGGGSLFAQGKGGIIAQGGGNIIAQGGGNIISQGGGNIIAQGGGNLKASDASLITNDGGTLVAESGNAVISNDGGTVISNDGGTVISNDGGTLINHAEGGLGVQPAGNGSAKALHRVASSFHLAQAQSLPAGLPLPVGGMILRAYALTDGKPLPLGEDAQHKPVMAIATNRAGGYKVYLPTSALGNVRLEGSLPSTGGGRLTYPLLPNCADGGEFNEDTVALSRYLLEGFASRLEYYIALDNDSLLRDFTRASGLADLAEAFAVGLRPLHDAVGPANTRLDPASFHQRALFATGLVLTSPALHLCDLMPIYDLQDQGPYLESFRKLDAGRTAMQVMLEVLRNGRRAVTARMQERLDAHQDPAAYFRNLGVFQNYRAIVQAQYTPAQLKARPELDPDALFAKPYATDFNLFIIRAYLSDTVLAGDGLAMEERLRFHALDRIFGGVASGAKEKPPTPLDGLYVTAPNPGSPPALTGAPGLAGEAALSKEDAFLPYTALRLSTASKAVSQAIVFALKDPDTNARIVKVLSTRTAP